MIKTMKKILFLGLLLCCGFVFAQDVEERNELSLENSKIINHLEVKMPFYSLAIKGCASQTPAEFDGGIYAFKRLLERYMYNYLNSDMYKLNGDFIFIITIDENGNIIQSEGTPKIENSQYFFDDMRYVFRRIKQKWTPATCGGLPTTSQVKIKMAFSSLSIEL